jgi:hypothetical protein
MLESVVLIQIKLCKTIPGMCKDEAFWYSLDNAVQSCTSQEFWSSMLVMIVELMW